MAEQFLDASEIRPAGEKVRGVAVAQRVGMNFFSERAAVHRFFENSLNPARGKTASAAIDQKKSGIRDAAFAKNSFFFRGIIFQKMHESFGERNFADLSSLSENANHTGAPVQIRFAEIRR